ncbi:MAG: hypothetical protein ACYTXI_40025 [Nostoc sp.]
MNKQQVTHHSNCPHQQGFRQSEKESMGGDDYTPPRKAIAL